MWLWMAGRRSVGRNEAFGMKRAVDGAIETVIDGDVHGGLRVRDVGVDLPELRVAHCGGELEMIKKDACINQAPSHRPPALLAPPDAKPVTTQ